MTRSTLSLTLPWRLSAPPAPTPAPARSSAARTTAPVSPDRWTPSARVRAAMAAREAAATVEPVGGGLPGGWMAIGAQGENVRGLQQALLAAGCDPQGVDGLFGPLTQQAVIAFQQARGLQVDGIVGPQTAGALGIALGGPAPAPAAPTGSVAAPVPNWRGVISQHWGGPGGHPGVDLAVPSGTPIQAAKDGTVVYAEFNQGGYGNLAILQHADGTFTMYAHQSQLEVAAGQTVRAGQEIGRVGSTGDSTGPHLHFEVRQGGEVWSSPTIDPEAYLAGA